MSHIRRSRWVFVAALGALVVGCAGSGSKVMQDFGLQERPDDYVSGSDRVMATLPEVAKTELTRLNAASRTGEVLYEKMDALTGAYYKKARVYEEFRPLDANYTNRTNANETDSYVGYIEYTYQIHESPRRPSRIEAMAENASIPTGVRGSETFRYRFSMSGSWNGAKGEPVKLR